MPLKHVTETVLVFVLTLAIVVTGLIVGVLPPVSQSIIPWLVAFILSVAYPLALYPLLRSRRADYPFRVLHFTPAAMLLVWLALDIFSSYVPFFGLLRGVFVWGWAVLGILIAFILIAWFCLHVIRQRTSRLGLLAAVFLPFVVFALWSERSQWRADLAGDVAARFGGTGTGTQIAVDDGRNTSVSDDRDEERYRAQMRRMDRRNDRLQDDDGEGSLVLSTSSSSAPLFVGITSSSSVSSAGAQSSATEVAVVSSSSSKQGWSLWGAWGGTGNTSSVGSAVSSASSASSVIIAAKPPPHLSSSGPGEIAGMGVLFAAAYCGVLHRRILKRRRLFEQ